MRPLGARACCCEAPTVVVVAAAAAHSAVICLALHIGCSDKGNRGYCSRCCGCDCGDVFVFTRAQWAVVCMCLAHRRAIVVVGAVVACVAEADVCSRERARSATLSRFGRRLFERRRVHAG